MIDEQTDVEAGMRGTTVALGNSAGSFTKEQEEDQMGVDETTTGTRFTTVCGVNTEVTLHFCSSKFKPFFWTSGSGSGCRTSG